SLTEDGTYGDMPTVTYVNDCGTIYYKASAPNHSDVTGSFTVSMNKADQAKPDAPTKISATISSITLNVIAGFEYRISTGDWQDSNVFSGLDMNTEYSFYQRIKGDDNYNASPESDAAVLRTNDHSHEWTYTSSGAVITATCGNSDTGHSGELTSTLTIVAPTLNVYGGTGSAEATITGSIDGVTNPDIVYMSGDTVLSGAPTDAGTYTANITLGEATATVEYTIAPAALTGVNVEQSGTLTYTGEAQTPVVTTSATAVDGQSITFTYSLTQDGTYGDMPTVINVNDCGTIYYKASAPNHGDVTGSFTVSMNKADKEAPAAPTATSTSVNSITLDSIPNGRYKLGDGEWQTSPTFIGLEMNTSYTFYQKYAEDSNYNESLSSAGADISTSNHVHEWSYQADGTTITATCADTDGGHGTPNTATLTLIRPELTKYGGTESAEVTFTGGIDGVVPVVVYKKGNDVLDGAPTDAGSYTASVTIDGVTASIEYEIEKADAPVLSDGQKPTKNENIIYDGTKKELITGSDDNITGYTMKYAVTTTDTVPDDSEFDTSIPKETNAGAYYVWYKAFADNSNNCEDTELASLLVNIAPRKVTVSGIIALDKTYDGTDSAILDYSNVTFDGIVDDDTLTVSATGKFVDSDVFVDGSGEVVAKIVNITGLILDGADVDNYELAQDGQQTTTTATIKKKAVTVTALDQIVAVEGNIDDSLDMAVLDGAVEGHKLAEIKLTSGSTASATTEGVITPGEAKIVSGDVDVTDNYEITYINGVMTVTKADSEVILDKTSVGEDTSVAAVESPNLQEFADKLAEDGKLVKVELNVKPVAEDELEADAVSGINAAADKLFANVGKETVKIEYLEIDMTKYVDGIKQGAISDTNTPIEIAVTYNTDKAKNPVVIRRHDGAVSVFDLLSSKPAGSYKDASYYLEGDKIHIYSQYFSDFAIVYSVEKTFNVNLDNGMDEVIRVIVPEGTKYTPPTDLTKDGYDFGGWYKDETFTEKWNPDTDTVTADMKLFAKWVKKADSTTPATPATTQTVTPAATNTTPAADTTKKSVDTGDHSHVAVAIMLMIDSVLAAVYLTLLKRKRLK
ncbi:MAG: InlB B-repeat-containing protein, partial [Lachnospiraceae bacterium]|nr:InlB B-repeat-containing protein [Lachnospiraceae bacterium]